MEVGESGWEQGFSTTRKSKSNQTVNTGNTNMDLNAFHLKNVNKLIIAHLNVNS